MKTYRVYFKTTASMSVDVQVTDEVAENADDINALVIELAEDDLPTDICAQCAGYHQRTYSNAYHWSRELGEWELATERKVDDDGDVYFVEVEPRLVENES